MSRGIDLTQGEYIARMDADDISMPERFEQQVRYMEVNPKCIVCGTALQWFMDNKDIRTKVYIILLTGVKDY